MVALNTPWSGYQGLVLGGGAEVAAPVVVPAGRRPIVPALGNRFIAMFKDTPMLSTIAIVEMLGAAKILGSETFRYLEPLTLVGIYFLIMSLAAAWGTRRLEAALALPGGRHV